MTTVVGVQYKNGFVLAADSQITDGDRPFISPDVPKITEVNEYVLAGAGVSRYCDIILYGWKPPVYDGTDEYVFMVSKFIPEMRKAHEETGYTLKDDDSFQFIVGLNNSLFAITEDYSVIRTNTNVYGVGSGSLYAIGALFAGANIREAVKIAIKLDINSGGKIQIVRRGEQNA
jgi:ATP-dependent protease HslVU (ClpYQ) peptidase subunit